MTNPHSENHSTRDACDIGIYSYTQDDPNNSNTYELSHENTTYYWKIQHVNRSVAAIQFFSDRTFANRIDVPDGIQIRSSDGIERPYRQSFFISWIADYRLELHGNPFWTLHNSKQQSVHTVGMANVRRL
jgi:hypothetical protein